ncbi:right-handed parallel beta-helix repeat-containing protein [Dactylosporangium sp. CS-047395]|uniref:right-handed parallel beta-helix repeat-containing protein n=1 Tax=Dactylosporangium sp. CS-047395 TaxID=3239936 RepID=UPI003D937878
MANRAILTVLATAGAAVLATAGPAHADVPALFVNVLAPAGCSDAGTGTEAQPFCKISAALAVATAGQTINVSGTYNERVTFPRSGEPGRPITLRANPVARLAGSQSVGFEISNRREIAISGINVASAGVGAGISVTGSTAITLDNMSIQVATGVAVPGVRVAGTADSSLTNIRISGDMTTGIALDAATSGVRLEAVQVGAPYQRAGTKGIDVLGSHNTILNSAVTGGGDAGIAFGPGADGNVVANTFVSFSLGVGIDNVGATGTAITNNQVEGNCKSGVRVAGAATGVSVQNNVLRQNRSGADNANCDRSFQGAVAVGIYDGAVGHTVADYNNVYQGFAAGAPDAYAWNGTVMGMTAFRAASGQAAHDVEGDTAPTEDAANSAAPGWPAKDRLGNAREDNPLLGNTGAGPVPYADRGALEQTKGPQANLELRADQPTSTVTADASATRPGYTPVAAYTFDFGDGTTLTQAGPIATHRYPTPGTYLVQVKATDGNGHAALSQQPVSLWPTARTIALQANENNGFVHGGPDGGNFLDPTSSSVGPAELFELIDLGAGRVALRSRINQQYVAVNYGTQPVLSATSPATDDPSTVFDLVTNADGTISLRSLSRNAYVSGNGGHNVLTADRSTIGPWERFGVVDQANANVTLHAHANGKYVTADNGGNSPLIANRTATGQWETFDLVDAGGGWVALYSHANRKFVTAENGGNAALIANRTTVGAWEKFKIVKNADGSTSLQANANGKYVTADNGGNSPLIANRTAVGPWEEFDRA